VRVFGRALKWGNPKAAGIVIFDETNSHIVRRALPDGYAVTVLSVGPEDLRVSVRIALWAVRLVGRLSFGDAREHPLGTLRGILYQIRCIYLEAYLVTMSPKAVVTFIDNSGPFGWLSKRCRRFPFFAIQNGTRLTYASTDQAYYCQHLFCFGTHEVEQLPRLGYQVENFHPVGSLLASLSFVPPTGLMAEDLDLLVVSTWRGNIGFGQDVQDTMRSMRIMDAYLAEYVGRRRLKAAVILRAEREGEHWRIPELGMTEEEYYKQLYGSAVEIVETNFVTRNIFPLMQRSRVIVSCLSTALLEAFGIGKKVLYCNFTGTNRYHDHLHPAIVTTVAERHAFFDRLDSLFKLSQEEWRRQLGGLQAHYMSNAGDEITSAVIARTIDEVIKRKNENWNSK